MGGKGKDEKREEKRRKRKKRRVKGRKKGNTSKKEGKYPYFVSLFNIGPYDSQNVCKNGKIKKKKNRGGEKDFSGWP